MRTSRCPKADDDDIGMRLHLVRRKSIFLRWPAAATAEVINCGICITRSHADERWSPDAAHEGGSLGMMQA
jgi:hypothetical protein